MSVFSLSKFLQWRVNSPASSRQQIRTDGSLGLPRDHRESGRQPITHFRDVRSLSRAALDQDRIAESLAREALVDDPGVRLDASPLEVVLQPRRFVNGSRLRQRHQQNTRELGVSKARKELPHRIRHIAHRARDVAVVGFGRIQQQDGVSGGSCVEHHEGVLPFGDGSRERTEHRDFLGTR